MIIDLRARGRGGQESASAGLGWRPVRQAAGGRPALPGRRERSMMTGASRRLRPHCRFTHSARNCPLNLARAPFCRGAPRLALPGAGPPGGEPRVDRLGGACWPIITAPAGGASGRTSARPCHPRGRHLGSAPRASPRRAIAGSSALAYPVAWAARHLLGNPAARPTIVPGPASGAQLRCPIPLRLRWPRPSP